MHRRTMLGVLGGAAYGLAALSGDEAKAGDDPKANALEECSCKCVEACSNGMNWCEETFLHASKQLASGKAQYAKAMHLFNDCGEVCGTTAKLVARTSPLSASLCRACIESCTACVSEGEKLGDAKMKEALDALRACSSSCREMLKTLGSAACCGEACCSK